jgi:hypothetical protein
MPIASNCLTTSSEHLGGNKLGLSHFLPWLQAQADLLEQVHLVNPISENPETSGSAMDALGQVELIDRQKLYVAQLNL